MDDQYVLTTDPNNWDGIEFYPTLQEARDRREGYMDESGIPADSPQRDRVHIYRVVFVE